jgi:hypothetical protein
VCWDWTCSPLMKRTLFAVVRPHYVKFSGTHVFTCSPLMKKTLFAVVRPHYVKFSGTHVFVLTCLHCECMLPRNYGHKTGSTYLLYTPRLVSHSASGMHSISTCECLLPRNYGHKTGLMYLLYTSRLVSHSASGMPFISTLATCFYIDMIALCFSAAVKLRY